MAIYVGHDPVPNVGTRNGDRFQYNTLHATTSGAILLASLLGAIDEIELESLMEINDHGWPLAHLTGTLSAFWNVLRLWTS